MITFIIASVIFLGGVYVGARYSGKLLEIWKSIVG